MLVLVSNPKPASMQYRRGINQEELQDVFMESNFFMFVFEGVLRDFSRLWIQKKEN